MADPVQDIKDLEERRRQAMLAADLAVLDSLCAEQLSYTHSNAEVDTKAQYLEKVGAAYFDYRELAFHDQEVRIVGDTALVIGRMSGDVVIAGTVKHLNSQTTVVWIRRDGHWKLLSFQSTPLPVA